MSEIKGLYTQFKDIKETLAGIEDNTETLCTNVKHISIRLEDHHEKVGARFEKLENLMYPMYSFNYCFTLVCILCAMLIFKLL